MMRCARAGYDPDENTFVQSFGDATLDASLLLIPIVGFLPPDDPRVQGTVAAVERKLLREGFVMRYDTGTAVDGLPPGEGAFLACSFWLVDTYVLLGRYEEARALFERLLALRNDVGLCWRRNTILIAAVSLATSPRRSRIWRSSMPRTASAPGRARLACARKSRSRFSQGRR